jgi:hypothetical protein
MVCTHMSGSCKPKAKQFDVGDFVYLQRQLNDTLDTSFDCIILKIKAIRPLSVLELQGINGCTIQDHSKNYGPSHLPHLDPTIITLTWIPPLDYPCQVCQRSSFKFSPTFGIVHHVLLRHLDFYSNHATLFLAQV